MDFKCYVIHKKSFELNNDNNFKYLFFPKILIYGFVKKSVFKDIYNK